jgi:aminopeptidase-like protein
MEPVEGRWMHALASRLFPFPRSLSGDGVRLTLSTIAKELPGLRIHEVPSGTRAFDWTVPHEWNITDASLSDAAGAVIADFSDSNLHVVGYSEPIDTVMSLTELDSHLHSDPELPEAIPYVTSYYNRTWGFCLRDDVRRQLKDSDYRIRIDSSLAPGTLTYGELILPGATSSEVLLSTYICHPSLANNELSGPVVLSALAKWLKQHGHRFTYRILFIPETIGALVYSSLHLDELRRHVIAGINLTCIGDDGDYSYLASREGNTPIDRIARRVIRDTPQPVEYSYLDRGSDERTYSAPGIDLPLISLMRTKYGKYRGYHTSLDNLDFVTPTGLQGGLNLVRDVLNELEESHYYLTTVRGEPQLGRRGLYHTIHARTVEDEVLLRTHILAYSDGLHSLLDIAELTGRKPEEIESLAQELLDHGLLVETDPRRGEIPDEYASILCEES